MLLKSIVRKTLEINRHIIKEVKEVDGEIVLRLDVRNGWKQPCGTCGTLGKIRDRLKVRHWKHVSLWGFPVRLEYGPARVQCGVCDEIKGCAGRVFHN